MKSVAWFVVWGGLIYLNLLLADYAFTGLVNPEWWVEIIVGAILAPAIADWATHGS